jgi:uncharacterized protein (TIGR03032 family)
VESNATNPEPALSIDTSRQFNAWLNEQNCAIALTTYQIGKLFLLGLKPSGELSVFERNFSRCMGLCPSPNGFYMSSLNQIWRFENVLEQGQLHDHFDRLYIPQMSYTTGDLDVHDMAVDNDGQLLFINTLFGCLATVSVTHSFKPLWKPPFLSKLAAEDRCHLNGLAMKDGKAAFVTAVARCDVADGWREHRSNGGIVIDIASNEIVLSGLSMPHSPRWHDGKLWLFNSGTGEFGYADFASGRFEPLCFCPGYMRGLSFHGNFAIIGLSRPRDNKTFSGLALDDQLASRNAQPRCGLQVLDLRTGDVVHWLRFEGLVQELYDVIVLPCVRSPMALGFKTDEINRLISIEQ